MNQKDFYLMESDEEAVRLKIKTDPEAVRTQALWCGVKPGMRILDAGCGPGITTSILHSMAKPYGHVIGVDYSEQRIGYAREHYGDDNGIEFLIHDLKNPLDEFGKFDIVWIRFVLEYHRVGSFEIVKNLQECLKPGGMLCLLDLDYNCLSHYELPAGMNDVLHKIMERLENKFNIDVYAGRKLYSYLFDLGFEQIDATLMAHHLFYGDNIRTEDIFNWIKKIEVTSKWMDDLFETYPGGYEAFYNDFKQFLLNPRRFTYTPLIICKGRKPE